MIPETKYARVQNINIAYQVVGDGPMDLVLVPGWVSNIEVFWEEPRVARFFQRLSAFSRLILFDKRGTGLSDRITEAATLEERMDDVRAVLDAIGSPRAALLGYSEGGPMCALFAATYPERTAALITMGSYARRVRAPDYPYFVTKEEALKIVAAAEADWGGPVGIEERVPSVSQDPIARKWWAKYLRMSATGSAAAALYRLNLDIDVRHLLPSIRVPTLILHATGDRLVPIELGRYLAARIPNAKLVEIDSIDHVPFFDRSDVYLHHIESFLVGSSAPAAIDSTVSTLMFTDMVGSTQMAVEKGNSRFGDILEAHHAAVRAELALYRGREIDTAGDGFLASFDGPARAIKCGVSIIQSLKAIGINCRVGLHTGECEVREGRMRGIALNVAARVAALAPASGVLVSQTVRDLVAGSGLKFADAGSHVLKGLPDEWRLYTVVA